MEIKNKKNYRWKDLPPIRTLSEILIEADTCNDIRKIKELALELANNKDWYLLHEVEFGLEHLLSLGEDLKGKLEINMMFNGEI